MLHGILVLALLLIRWPESGALAKIVLLLLVWLECLRSRQRIRCQRGDITLREGGVIGWQQHPWYITARPWLTPLAVCLSLRDARGRHKQLWLFADGMEPGQWRLLRQQLLNEKEIRDE